MTSHVRACAFELVRILRLSVRTVGGRSRCATRQWSARSPVKRLKVKPSVWSERTIRVVVRYRGGDRRRRPCVRCGPCGCALRAGTMIHVCSRFITVRNLPNGTEQSAIIINSCCCARINNTTVDSTVSCCSAELAAREEPIRCAVTGVSAVDFEEHQRVAPSALAIHRTQTWGRPDLFRAARRVL